MRLYSIVYKIRRIEMQQIILGSAGFLLYFIYDINSVRKQNRLLRKIFRSGHYSGCFVTVHGTLVCMGTVQSQDRKNDWIRNRSNVLFGTSYIHLVFSLFLLSKPIVKKTDYGLHTQKGCMDCVGIPAFCGLQVHIFVCGECLAVWKQGI